MLPVKFWEGNVFTPVCDSVHRGCVPVCNGQGGVHPQADTPQTDTPRQTPPWTDTPTEMATEVGGTHPTGMHSCLNYIFKSLDKTNRDSVPIAT